MAKASFLEYDRDRLLLHCPERKEQMRKATTQRLDDARCAAGVRGNGAGRRNTLISRLANIWTGDLIEGAFANLHIVEVALVDLYEDEDVRARAPGVLARMRVCLPPTDQRRLQAEALFGAKSTMHCRGQCRHRTVGLGPSCERCADSRVPQASTVPATISADVGLLCARR